MMATGGREASRERRSMIVRGRSALPAAAERSRGPGTDSRVGRGQGAADTHAPAPAQAARTPEPAPSASPTATQPPAPQSGSSATYGRDVARERRRAGARSGKPGLQQPQDAPAAAQSAAASESGAKDSAAVGTGRAYASYVRAARSTRGRGDAPACRPTGRCRPQSLLTYAPKVAVSTTEGGEHVTGVRIGRGKNVTGDEPGATIAVTGAQYLGKEQGIISRPGGQKVGAARTAAGLVVTGTQVRSAVSVTGDESNAAIFITGQADQEVADDLIGRRDHGSYAPSQFQRQHNPHGHTVFGTNLGRLARGMGSRQRAQERAVEHTEKGQTISGTAVGRSQRVTGDEAGACRSITGDQYLDQRNACELPAQGADLVSARPAQGSARPDHVTGDKVTISESQKGARITGVKVEHDRRVTGDEYGACVEVTGTPYVGRTQFAAACAPDKSGAPAAQTSVGGRVTGDTPRHVDHVTGTGRGVGQSVTGTPYYRKEQAAEAPGDFKARMSRIAGRFSVNWPQRDAQLQVGAGPVEEPGATGRITGTFARGEGKITGNQEFIYRPRTASSERPAHMLATGEASIKGRTVTGSAWTEDGKVTGTEGTSAVERNPSERAGKPHAFAGATQFKGKGIKEEIRQMVTGMVGWSAKTSAKVTISGGSQG